MLTYRDREGSRISRSAWELLIADESYCVVAEGFVTAGRCVCTRWTGLSDSEIDPLPFSFVTAVWTRQTTGWALLPESMLVSVTEHGATSAHERLLGAEADGAAPVGCDVATGS